MPKVGSAHTGSLTGEVVEIFERDGEQIATILFRSIQLEVPMQTLDAAHLGDIVSVDALISIKNIEPFFRAADPGSEPDNEVNP